MIFIYLLLFYFLFFSSNNLLSKVHYDRLIWTGRIGDYPRPREDWKPIYPRDIWFFLNYPERDS